MAKLPANVEAEARGQAPAVVPLDDGVTNVRARVDLPFLNPVAAGGFDPFRAQAWPHGPSQLEETWTVRAFDKWSDTRGLTGHHGPAVRQASGMPVGEFLPFASPVRAVLRPVPGAWDAGFTEDPAAPAGPARG